MTQGPQNYNIPPDNLKGGWDTRPEEYKDLGLSIGLPPNIILRLHKIVVINLNFYKRAVIIYFKYKNNRI